MTLLATITNPNFEVSKLEIESEQVSYTINTIKKFISMIDSNEVELFFITGADAIMQIENWKNYDELLKLCNFIGATRPGINEIQLREKIIYLKEKYHANIYLT